MANCQLWLTEIVIGGWFGIVLGGLFTKNTQWLNGVYNPFSAATPTTTKIYNKYLKMRYYNNLASYL